VVKVKKNENTNRGRRRSNLPAVAARA